MQNQKNKNLSWLLVVLFGLSATLIELYFLHTYSLSDLIFLNDWLNDHPPYLRYQDFVPVLLAFNTSIIFGIFAFVSARKK
jgi:hypothetical protein